ncbi:MAG: FimV/HubP family polar landmark protein [Hydrogenophaga sp.]|uniref:FimV/HubP family polar landmark protein n=1 Tax=Hydrogenophaga sp. TaxID=1904254 RepID=UPI002771A2EA|nr:FimV/HubP family polar landmark protein [Hydrogenophaga sp.]MDP2417913.1 FimV/HubP family polar landmark protein [Hydrogenophaga sp.]MDZ4186763.1 FimV/HubP family polar landmark protein [Hydrogenophaga sp.]
MTSNTCYTLTQSVSTHPRAAGSRGFARLHAVAAAVVLSTGLAHFGDAQALALGRIVVQSALGEPLKAEIDVPDINTDEAASLRVNLASGAAFRAAGMDFNAALSSLQITLQRRTNGSAFLKLTSTRPVNEPFVDLIVEANWASGRIVRDYTLLLDPPNLRAATPVAPLPAAVATQPESQARPLATRPSAPAVQTEQPPAPTTPVIAPGPVAAPTKRLQPEAPVARPVATPSPKALDAQVVVKAGDTAGRIAAANKPPQVSLDQMLVAMLRANPNAFIAGNVNRIKAGSVLDLPDATTVESVSPDEARQTIVAQSRDFNEFRRRLADTIPAATVAAADRQASGRIQTEVQDQKPVAPTQDKLTLSKGVSPAETASTEKIAQERQAQEASSRVAELSRNIDDLAKLGAGTGSAPPAPNATATASPAIAVAAPTLAVPVEPPPTTVTPTPEASPTASLPSTTETTPTTAPAAPVIKPAPTPVPEPLPEAPSLIDELRDNPLVLPAAGGLLVLLAGLAFYRLRQRKRDHGVDSSFLESRLQPDSFFGASGGQRIDTTDASVSGSSMVYSPSQLDAAGDVDPVAEADVYLAYGRDLQAEEILKEAMRNTPQRVAIHSKLLEIYAKRRDVKAFEVVATEAFDLTQGHGTEWEQVCTLGRELDPANPLYEPGGRPPAKGGSLGAFMAGGALNTVQLNPSKLPQNSGMGVTDNPMSLDLDLDFSIDEPSTPINTSFSTASAVSGMGDLARTDALTQEPRMRDASPASIPFDLDFPSEPAPIEIPSPAGQSTSLGLVDANMLAFDGNDVLANFDLDEQQPFNQPNKDQSTPQIQKQSAQSSPFDTDAELLSFDLNDIQPDTEASDTQSSEEDEKLVEENPLDTKLALAEEFRSIGYMEGARSLAEEVLAEASGTLKTKASKFLADLN